MSRQPRVLFFIPEDWYIVSHRLPLLRVAKAMGCEVTVVTSVKNHAQPITETGARLIPVTLRRGYKGPLRDIGGLMELIRIYRRVRPDLVHHVTLKSIVFGSIAARLSGVKCMVNAFAGLGFVFTSQNPKARIFGAFIRRFLRFLLSGHRNRLIVQNADDMQFFNRSVGVPTSRIELIRGAGVDTETFAPTPPPDVPPLRVVLVARMLRDKGIGETVAAARLLRERGRTDIEIILAGRIDPDNPEGIAADELRKWEADGLIRWLGHVDDVPSLLGTCHVALLPSYREGLPKSLLECASCGLPVVATDVPGCREICLKGVNGLSVPARQVGPIADALEALADDKPLRERYGAESRRLVLEHFAEGIITQQTAGVYGTLLAEIGLDHA